MNINLGNGTVAEITSIEDIDLDEEVVYFEGERLSEARAEAIARDISAQDCGKGGRPSLVEGANSTTARPPESASPTPPPTVPATAMGLLNRR